MNVVPPMPAIEASRELRDVCAIAGTATSRLGKVPGVSSLDLLCRSDPQCARRCRPESLRRRRRNLPRPGRIPIRIIRWWPNGSA